MTRHRVIDYTDELLADGTLHRRFADGRQEWRRRGNGVVQWRDNAGNQGTDELLGRRIIKRMTSDGQVVYARELGYGRTSWQGNIVTRNRTTFSGRMGAILAAVGAGALLGAVVAPPLVLSPFEEDELRRQAQQQQQSNSGDSGGSGGGDSGGGDGSGDSDWDDDGAGDSDDDFG